MKISLEGVDSDNNIVTTAAKKETEIGGPPEESKEYQTKSKALQQEAQRSNEKELQATPQSEDF